MDKNLLKEKQGDALHRHLRYARYFNQLNIIVFTAESDGFSDPKYSGENLHIFPTHSRSRWLFVSDALKIARTLKKQQRIDLVSTQDPFLTAIAGWLIKLFSGAHLNIQIHNDYQSPYWKNESIQNRVFSLILPLTLRLADSVRAVSKLTAIIAPDQDQVFVAPIAVDTEFFKPQQVKKDYDIICVARMDKQKNIPLLINAISGLKEKFPNIRTVIVGGGGQKNRFEQLVREKGLQRNVTLTGSVGRKSVRSLLWKSKIFVLPSNYEGWGLAAVEAAACGLPIIMTDTGGAKEIAADGKSEYIIPVGNEVQLRNRIEDLLNDSPKRRFMGNQARRLVNKVASREEFPKALIRQYAKWIGAGDK